MDFMVDAFLCLVLDVFGLAQSKVSSVSLPWASFQGPENNAFDLDSRFLVASRPVPDLLFFRQTFVRRCQNCVARASNARRLNRVRVL
jgi:hypothetical protein